MNIVSRIFRKNQRMPTAPRVWFEVAHRFTGFQIADRYVRVNFFPATGSRGSSVNVKRVLSSHSSQYFIGFDFQRAPNTDRRG
jgi:hypothetical protein